MTAEAPRDRSPLVRFVEVFRSGGWRSAGLSAGILAAVALVGIFVSVEVTSRPKFCGSCHIMKPYYESWKHSSHKNIECVECHIPPGVTAEIEKKFEALSMVARYFTGTYGTNPWTEIEDAACLRCHERRLLMGKEMLGDVLFDHSEHLVEMRRGKTLRCTSCHSQIVQGSHIAVTTSTCVLCHFKDQIPGQGMARCTLCHLNPQKTVRAGEVTFDHAKAERFGMECTWCHAQPKGSTGEVPRERCVTCHNQAARLEKYGETELLHRKHVTEHKIDCMDCHLLLEHVVPVEAKTAAARIATAAGDCGSCHDTSHSPQLSLYTGMGGRGVRPMPSVMYEAGVRCEGCHMEIPGHGGDVNRASDISCMACHGAAYETIYRNWKSGAERRTAAVAAQLEATARALGGAASPRLEDARHNVRLVERAHGIHNIPYAYALLRKSHEDLNAARRERGLAPLPRPWVDPPYESPCLECHAGIEDQSGEIFGRRFFHERHVVGQKIDCMKCHRTHEEKPEGEIVRFAASGCESCHHAKADVKRAETCVPCHEEIRKGTVASFRGRFSHALHVDEEEIACATCHELAAGAAPRLKRDACQECHEE